MSDKEVARVQERFEQMFRAGTTPWTEHELELSIRQLPEKLLRERPEPALLDVGCGNGWVSLYFASQGITVTGIDSSKTAIAEAKQVAKRSQLADRAAFDVGNGLELPYEADRFDAVLDRGFFHHVPEDEYARYLAEVPRVLKNGGLFSLHAFTKRNERMAHEFSTEDIVRIFGGQFELLEHSEDPWPTSAPAHLGHYLLRHKKLS